MAEYSNREVDSKGSTKETNMGDIAGLLSLMQANKGMDIPGLLALCKDKGYDKAWGGEFMFIFVFLILFMWGGGGWGNLGRNNQAAATDLAAAAGMNLQDIIAVSDKISQAQSSNMAAFNNTNSQMMHGFNNLQSSTSSGFNQLTNAQNQGFAGVNAQIVDSTNAIGSNVTSGFRDVQSALCQGFNNINTGMMTSFNTLDTKICQSIAEVMAGVRNQGDRIYDATRTVGDAIRDCCCALNNKLDQVMCTTKGLYDHTSLVGERVMNNMDKQFCATDQKIDALKGEMMLGFERVNCNIVNTAKEQELQRLQREVSELKSSQNNSIIASGVMSSLKDMLAANKVSTAAS